jgi:threonyl-tRNA synthetase
LKKKCRRLLLKNLTLLKQFTQRKSDQEFSDIKEDYKVKIIEESDQEDNFQLYNQGDTGFIDLCRGPHLPSLDKVGAFKLTKIAGAYWKGDSQNEMLSRIYGTAWKNDKDLKKYLTLWRRLKSETIASLPKKWIYSIARRGPWNGFLACKRLVYLCSFAELYT